MFPFLMDMNKSTTKYRWSCILWTSAPSQNALQNKISTPIFHYTMSLPLSAHNNDSVRKARPPRMSRCMTNLRSSQSPLESQFSSSPRTSSVSKTHYKALKNFDRMFQVESFRESTEDSGIDTTSIATTMTRSPPSSPSSPSKFKLKLMEMYFFAQDPPNGVFEPPLAGSNDE